MKKISTFKKSVTMAAIAMFSCAAGAWALASFFLLNTSL